MNKIENKCWNCGSLGDCKQASGSVRNCPHFSHKIGKQRLQSKVRYYTKYSHKLLQRAKECGLDVFQRNDLLYIREAII